MTISQVVQGANKKKMELMKKYSFHISNKNGKIVLSTIDLKVYQKKIHPLIFDQILNI